MAVDKEAIICLSRVYSYYFKCNFVRDDDELFTKLESAGFRHSWIRMFTFDSK